MDHIKPVASLPVDEVISALEEALVEARAGSLRNIAIIGDSSSGSAYYTNWGYFDHRALLGVLVHLQFKICGDLPDEG